MNSPTPKSHTPRSTPDYLSNFRDPVGLAKRMVCSGNSTAYWSLLREAMRPAVMPLDWAMQRGERRLLERDFDLTEPVLLIVGPPRSGTTLLYQVLADSLDASWFPNVSEMFPRAPIMATRRFARQGKTGVSSLRSFYGQTSGLSHPNDGFHIWNRWLGVDRYEPTMREGAESEVLRFLGAWTNAFQKPLINKNNRNTLCIASLAQTIPTAHVVVLRRDPADIARSLIRAREFVQGDRNAPWGLVSRANHSDEEYGYVTDVCDQLQDIHFRMEEQLAQIDPSRVTQCTYEELCEGPEALVRAIAQDSGIALRKNLPATLEAIRAPATRPLSGSEEQVLREQLVGFAETADIQTVP